MIVDDATTISKFTEELPDMLAVELLAREPKAATALAEAFANHQWFVKDDYGDD